jgi:hypothetical protein
MPATEGSMLRRKVSRQSPFLLLHTHRLSAPLTTRLPSRPLSSGQLEARERLLGEMESKARERVEAAEIESYRLKGRGGEKCSDFSLIKSLLNSVTVTRIISSFISPTTISFICFSSFLLSVSFILLGLLVHMEHVASALRGQGGEETERLRQEHHRLQVMQVTVVFPCPPSLPPFHDLKALQHLTIGSPDTFTFTFSTNLISPPCFASSRLPYIPCTPLSPSDISGVRATCTASQSSRGQLYDEAEGERHGGGGQEGTRGEEVRTVPALASTSPPLFR